MDWLRNQVWCVHWPKDNISRYISYLQVTSRLSTLFISSCSELLTLSLVSILPVSALAVATTIPGLSAG